MKTGVIIALSILVLLIACMPPAEKQTKDGILITNQKTIEGFESHKINLSNETEVFRYVFSNLDDEVTIYPTENYFYWKFPYQGKMIWGAISLTVEDRDKSILGLGYAEHSEDTDSLDMFPDIGGGGKLSEEQGVFIEKMDNFTYSVTFEGKSVIFHLFDDMKPPKKAKLTEDEIFVGPVFDEADVRLFLLYNKAVPHMYMILNEDEYVTEEFKPIGWKIVVGERTGFAYYEDKENNRKILVGVDGRHTLKNDWYDGPHDQMPDNFILTGQIPNYQEYIEKAYHVEGRIDKYGNYLEENGTRVAVAPYRVYFKNEDLYELQYCEQLNLSQSEFYNCITTQMFDVPDEIEEKMFADYTPQAPETPNPFTVK